MKQKLRILKGILIITLLFSITACGSSQDGNFSVTIEGGDLENFKQASSEEELKYFL